MCTALMHLKYALMLILALSDLPRKALDMQKTIQEFNAQTHNSLQLRIGINSGAVVAGVIGQKKFIYDLCSSNVSQQHRQS